jgi:dual specificity phosphatase 12
MEQLELFWQMGCPSGDDDAVRRHRIYRRWAYKKEVTEAARMGLPPGRLRFEDEADEEEDDNTPDQRAGRHETSALGEEGQRQGPKRLLQLRCKKCRRVLATDKFVIPHDNTNTSCPHMFIEALAWMRPVLEQGDLDGRLVCPGPKCAASVGRYAWQGFKCSCGEWVCPAFSLQRARIDEIWLDDASSETASRATSVGSARSRADERLRAMGVRLPPPISKDTQSSKENL